MAPIADRGLLGWKVDVVGVVDTCPNPSYLSLTGCSSGVVGASLAYHYGQVLGIPAQARHGPSCIFAWHMVVTDTVHGEFKHDVCSSQHELIVNGHKIKAWASDDLLEFPLMSSPRRKEAQNLAEQYPGVKVKSFGFGPDRF
ncbi:unnamed protein product [Symbiodinium natans]|uniref:Uncharacterized protein n=1 Tax=Symbiodinium natans TaxID=878477 RepID=A0A812R297_9DINO|nr:unnamed protein product [Symbiodinium natans]